MTPKEIIPLGNLSSPDFGDFKVNGVVEQALSRSGAATSEKYGVRHIAIQILDQELYPNGGVSARFYVKYCKIKSSAKMFKNCFQKDTLN